jgi:outer membrane protein assembly factor BamB
VAVPVAGLFLGLIGYGQTVAGSAERSGWDPGALAGGPRIAWRADVGFGHSAVAVKGDRLFTMGHTKRGEGESAVELDVVVCLHLDTGEVLWRHEYPCDDIYFSGPRATPEVDGERLYTLSWEGHLLCLDAGNGKLIWSRNIVDDGFATPGHWGLSGSPVVEGELLILTAGRSGLALNKKTGEVIWHSEPIETSLPTPVVLGPPEERLALLPGEETLYAVDIKTGRVVWTVPWEAGFHLPATIAGHKMFVPGSDGFTLFDLSRRLPAPLGDAATIGFSAYQSHAVVGDVAYGFSGSFLQCVDLKTGRRLWREEVGPHGALIVADGKLIILEGDGTLIIAAASPTGYRELSSAKVLELTDNRGVPLPKQNHCWTRPVLVDGRIIVRCNHGRLVCVDMRPSPVDPARPPGGATPDPAKPGT